MICLLGALVLPILDHSWNAEASDPSQGISANQETGDSITDQSEPRYLTYLQWFIAIHSWILFSQNHFQEDRSHKIDTWSDSLDIKYYSPYSLSSSWKLLFSELSLVQEVGVAWAGRGHVSDNYAICWNKTWSCNYWSQPRWLCFLSSSMKASNLCHDQVYTTTFMELKF